MRYFRIKGNYNGEPISLVWEGSRIVIRGRDSFEDPWEIDDVLIFDGELEAFVYLRGIARGLGIHDGGDTWLQECDEQERMIVEGESIEG